MTDAEKQRRFAKALAIGGNTHTVADVLDRIRECKAMCFATGDSVIVTEVIGTPRMKLLNYWIVSGRLQECAELQSAVDAWGVSEGCSVAMATGRLGWHRIWNTARDRLPGADEWKPTSIKFMKSLLRSPV